MPTTTPGLPSARKKAQTLIQQTCVDQANRHLDIYAAVRPQQIPSVWKAGQRLELDCSDYCRLICRVAGIPDPAGNGYAPFGNSSSIWAHCHHIPLADAQPGDIVTFGYYAGEKHACILLDQDSRGQWRVGNMGKPGQPVINWLAGEIAFHPGMTVTVCRVDAAPIPVTQADILRSETDFYSWMSWQFGWNAWKHYGAKNPHVRPNVPKVISPAWWLRRKQFLLNRKRANKAL
jgi:hypothetical protein